LAGAAEIGNHGFQRFIGKWTVHDILLLTGASSFFWLKKG
jgi:hypothetical protein